MIRDAVASDLPWVRELWALNWAEAPVRFRTWEELLGLQEAIFEGVVSGELPGVCLVSEGTGVLLWAAQRLEELCGFGVIVHPGRRGSGIGSALLEAGLQRAKEKGFRRVFVSPEAGNRRVIDWLSAEGFSTMQVVLGKEV